jgi:hypothetical protein
MSCRSRWSNVIKGKTCSLVFKGLPFKGVADDKKEDGKEKKETEDCSLLHIFPFAFVFLWLSECMYSCVLILLEEKTLHC